MPKVSSHHQHDSRKERVKVRAVLFDTMGSTQSQPERKAHSASCSSLSSTHHHLDAHPSGWTRCVGIWQIP